MKKAVYDYTAGAWTLSEERLFVYDGWNLVEEIRRQGGIETSRYFVWGQDLSGSLQGAGGIGGLVAEVDAAGGSGGSSLTYYFCYDGNGNVGQVVNAADGSIAAAYEYDPYGKIVRADGDKAGDNPFRFSTKYTDDETGLVYYGYRYYSPELGRWISRDPIGEKGGLNLYCMTTNNPFHTEMLGLFDYKAFFDDPRTPSPEEFVKLDTDVMNSMMKAWEKEREKYHSYKITDIFTPVELPKGGPIPPYFVGLEFHLIGGGGITFVKCCDDKENSHMFLYIKICFGAAAGGGVSGGPIIEGMNGAKCNYKNYQGWFFEGGASLGFAGAGVDVGVEESEYEIPLINTPYPTLKFNNTLESSGGLSAGKIQAKASWCYYIKIWNKEIKCGCKKGYKGFL